MVQAGAGGDKGMKCKEVLSLTKLPPVLLLFMAVEQINNHEKNLRCQHIKK